MSPSMAGKYISLAWEMTKSNMMSAMEYRFSFLTQVIGMFVNDIGLILLWVVFFSKFPSIRGWTLQDSALLLSFSTVVYGLILFFCGGAIELAKTITRGELDYFLSLPKNVLWQVAFSKSEMSALGDLIFGIVLFFFSGFVSFEKIGLFMVVSVTSALSVLNFIVITQSIAFYVGDFEAAAEQMFHALLGFSMYPQTSFYGVLKVVMLTILPAFFITTLPVQLIRRFDLQEFFVLTLFWALSTILALVVFDDGLKHYESGNLINVKM